MLHCIRRIHRRPFHQRHRDLVMQRLIRQKLINDGLIPSISQSEEQPAGDESTDHRHMLIRRSMVLGKDQMVSLATALLYCLSLAGVFIYEQIEQNQMLDR